MRTAPTFRSPVPTLCAALAVLAMHATPAALAAQTVQTVPANADLADGHQSVALPFGVPGFRTQLLLDAAAVAPNGAVLTGLRLRGDRASLPLPATSVPNVTIAASHCSIAPGSLGTAFAANVTGAPTVVFQGTVALPAIAAGAMGPTAGPLPWNVTIAFATPFAFTAAQGNLLLEITGNNAPGGTTSWWLDAGQQGGSVTSFGQAGTDPSFDSHGLLASTGNSLEPLLVAPGSFVDYTTTRSFASTPGVLLLGVAALPAPLDLGAFGAPTHSLHVAPLAWVPHAWTQSFLGWFATFRLQVPNAPAFVDQLVFAQSALLDPAANAAGLLTSNALETRLGDPQAVFPVQQLDALDPAAATGTLVDFGFGPTPRFGGAVVLLDGVFF